jgi:hypothetical protein
VVRCPSNDFLVIPKWHLCVISQSILCNMGLVGSKRNGRKSTHKVRGWTRLYILRHQILFTTSTTNQSPKKNQHTPMEAAIVAEVVGIKMGDNIIKNGFDEDEDDGNYRYAYDSDCTSQRLWNYIKELLVQMWIDRRQLTVCQET